MSREMSMPPGRRSCFQNMLTRLSPGMAAMHYEAGHWSDLSIYDATRAQALRAPDRTAVRDTHAALGYGDLIALADRLAADLEAAGLCAGDRVAVWLSPRVELAVVLLACARNGYVLCPSLHRNHTVEEIAALLERVRASALVGETGYGADGAQRDVFAAVRQRLPLRKAFRLAPPAARTAEAIAAELGLPAAGQDDPVGQADDVVYLAFTSGTTGRAKGVMHSNNTLLANARALAADWAFDADTVFYTLSPLSHNLGFGALVLALNVGGTLVIHDLARGASLLDRLRETGAQFVFGVPAHAMDLLREIDAGGEAQLPAMRGFRISGAAADPQVVERLLAHGITPQSGYGMTEGCSHHYTLPTDSAERIVSTSGRACPGYEVRIFSLDDPDRELPTGQIGQIGGRGASLMLGYFDDQLATEDAFNRGGWFLTGDLGRLDDHGYIRITGRLKDVIIRGGHNIYPAGIEAVAMRHPNVERAAVVPVKDRRLGEKVCIVVMPREDIRIDAEALLEHLHAGGVSRYDMPEYFLQVEEIPLSANGKIVKRELLAPIQDGRLAPTPVRWKVADGG